MPVCPKCGTYYDDNRNFCTECGQKLSGQPHEAENTEQPETNAWQDRYQQYRKDYGQHYEQYRQPQRSEAFFAPEEDRAPEDGGKALGIFSLVFGILGFVCCLFPAFSVAGLITGILGVRKSGRAVAKVGLILSVISLVLFLIALIITAVNGFDLSALKLEELMKMIGFY